VPDTSDSSSSSSSSSSSTAYFSRPAAPSQHSPFSAAVAGISTTSTGPAPPLRNRGKDEVEDTVFQLYECPACNAPIDMDNTACNVYTHTCGKAFCGVCGLVGNTAKDIYATLCWPNCGSGCQTTKLHPGHQCGTCIQFFCDGIETCVRVGCLHVYPRPSKCPLRVAAMPM
jgi:hypothetical protein